MPSRAGQLSGNESSENSTTVQSNIAKPIKIGVRHNVYSVAFLVDGKYIVSGDSEGKIRHRQVEDGKEVGTPMDAGSSVNNVTVSRDGRWLAAGTDNGQATLWNAKNRKKITECKGHKGWVFAVDVSPDGTRMATGSEDGTVCVWSVATGKRLLGPLEHDDSVVAVKYSPDGSFIATGTWNQESIRVYSGQKTQNDTDSSLIVDAPIEVSSTHNQSLVWAKNLLFALSSDGHINCLDVSTGTTLSRWPIHSTDEPRCIALANNGAFLAASANSTVSFWDTTTHQRIGSVIEHTDSIVSLATSANHDIVIGGGKTITLRNICHVLPSPYFDDIFPERALQRIKIERDDFEETVRKLHNQFSDSQRAAAQEKESLNKTIQSLQSEIAHIEVAFQQLREHHANSQHRAESIIRAHEQKHQCEALYAEGRIIDSAASLLEITNTIGEEVRANRLLMDWLTTFTDRCITTLEKIGDEASSAETHDEATKAYSHALALNPSTPDTLLIKWANTVLICGSANEALKAAAKSKLPRFHVYREICNVLQGGGRIMEAIECFRQMQSELGEDMSIQHERAQWELSFQQQCMEKLERLGDAAMNSRSYHEAAEHFSTVLSLNPPDCMDIFIKRSKARAMMDLWEEALSDADKAINIDPSSHRGYERRHAALHGTRRYTDAAEAHRRMLAKLDESPDEHIRGLRSRYVDATPTIRHIVQQTIPHMPRVLIDTATGRLSDKLQQAAAFEAHPIYSELVSSMTTELDHARIGNVVKEFYKYVMLSHKWESDEPLLQKVEHITIYELELSPANIKLQKFCSLVRSLGFRWAWSDVCCVDKSNSMVLQESLVAMFKWYRGSSLTIVYLRGVRSESQIRGDLQRSIWNTRAWTYQEYVAAEIIQFYTEDWKPYLGLTLYNHKESLDIISEMQQLPGVSAQGLAVFRPGFDRVRDKLYLASVRRTTLVEDVAYSLLGIFNASIPVIYGEGDRAVGRLLEHILTGSGDVTILAWTGRAGNYNSCLPINLTVYDQLVPPHIPQPIGIVEMDSMVRTLRSSLLDPSLPMMLHHRLSELPSPSLAASRLRLPGIIFRFSKLVHTLGPDPVTNMSVYRVTTSVFGDVEINTADDLTGMKDLCLVHPWIRPLLDQEFSDGAAGLDRTTQALRLVARLRQPFGAFLLEPLSRVEYRRVAADCLITVQVREEVSLTDLIENIHTIEVQ